MVLQVCFEFLFDSTRPTAVLACGHTIHSRCLHELQQANKTACPICMKSYGDMTLVPRPPPPPGGGSDHVAHLFTLKFCITNLFPYLVDHHVQSSGGTIVHLNRWYDVRLCYSSTADGSSVYAALCLCSCGKRKCRGNLGCGCA